MIVWYGKGWGEICPWRGVWVEKERVRRMSEGIRRRLMVEGGRVWGFGEEGEGIKGWA